MIDKLKTKLTIFKGGNSFKSFHIAFSQGLVALLFLAIDFIFSKKLSVYEFGYWKELFFIFNLGIPLLSFGLPEGFKYFIAKDTGKATHYLSNVFGIILSVSGFLFLILVLVNLLHFFNVIDLGLYYLISLLFPLPFIAFLSNKILRYLYINLNLTEKLTRLSIYASILSLIVIIASVFALDYFDYNFLIWAIIAYTIIFASTVLFYFKTSTLSLAGIALNTKSLKEMLNYGLPLYLAGFIGIITLQLDKLIVTLFETKEVFAIFAVGAFEIPAFAMLSAAFSQQIFPKMVNYVQNGDEYKAKNLWLETTKKVSYISYPVILLAMIFAEELLFFIYSSDYEESVFLFKTYLLVALFRNNSYGILLTVKAENKFIVKTTALMLFLNLILSILLYNIIGIQGIIFGTLISTFAIWLIYLVKEMIFIDYLKKILFNPVIFTFIIIILYFYFYD